MKQPVMAHNAPLESPPPGNTLLRPLSAHLSPFLPLFLPFLFPSIIPVTSIPFTCPIMNTFPFFHLLSPPLLHLPLSTYTLYIYLSINCYLSTFRSIYSSINLLLNKIWKRGKDRSMNGQIDKYSKRQIRKEMKRTRRRKLMNGATNCFSGIRIPCLDLPCPYNLEYITIGFLYLCHLIPLHLPSQHLTAAGISTRVPAGASHLVRL